jgi:hypothetical protein
MTALALARADVLERVRRSGFLVLTGLVLWLAYGAYQGNVHVRLGRFVGAWDSAWAGGMMAMIAGTYLSLFGFWFVKNAVERDERTGVGEILATTPLSRTSYVLGKALSHFTVLALMAGVLVASAVGIQLAKGGGAVRLLDYAAPFALVVLPSLAVSAACAILFETTPWLRGAFGNAAWMFLWTALFVGGMSVETPFQDLVGLRALERSMSAAIEAQFPGEHDHELSISLGPERSAGMRTFRWPGMTWTSSYLLARLAWLALALGVVLLAALPFHRFDPARGRRRAPPAGTRARPRAPRGGAPRATRPRPSSPIR